MNAYISLTKEILDLIEKQDAHLRNVADNLYFVHHSLQTATAPIYDVPTAIDVLTTGKYQRMPISIEV
jgi:mediator of RNA polymerase II transcription subunit 14